MCVFVYMYVYIYIYIYEDVHVCVKVIYLHSLNGRKVLIVLCHFLTVRTITNSCRLERDLVFKPGLIVYARIHTHQRKIIRVHTLRICDVCTWLEHAGIGSANVTECVCGQTHIKITDTMDANLFECALKDQCMKEQICPANFKCTSNYSSGQAR